jgi:hypothetical protein
VHLVFSLHVHSFAFLVLLVAIGVSECSESWRQTVTGVSQVLIIAHTWLGLRRVHRQGRLKTSLKMVCVGFGYLFLLIATMLVTVVLTVVTF